MDSARSRPAKRGRDEWVERQRDNRFPLARCSASDRNADLRRIDRTRAKGLKWKTPCRRRIAANRLETLTRKLPLCTPRRIRWGKNGLRGSRIFFIRAGRRGGKQTSA